MSKRKIIYGAIFILGILALVFGFVSVSAQSQELKVIFLNVGQGDSTLIMQGDKQVLIDGGPDGQVLLEKLGKYVPFWDRKIELIITTHPDQDHIQGLTDVLEKYQVGSVIQNSSESDSQIFKKYKDLLAQKRIDIINAQPGAKAEIGNGAGIEILGPLVEKNDKKDTNVDSVVAKLTFGKNNFLFTGDAPIGEEGDLLKSAEDISANVLKISHHGSKYATSQEFLEKVKPKEAVISVGKNNYGHPAPEVLDRLEKDKIKIIRTDESGDVEYDCLSINEDCSMFVN